MYLNYDATMQITSLHCVFTNLSVRAQCTHDTLL